MNFDEFDPCRLLIIDPNHGKVMNFFAHGHTLIFSAKELYQVLIPNSPHCSIVHLEGGLKAYLGLDLIDPSLV